jgi:hypothetical protein
VQNDMKEILMRIGPGSPTPLLKKLEKKEGANNDGNEVTNRENEDNYSTDGSSRGNDDREMRDTPRADV